MPKVIVANVDSDSMCGTDMPPEIHLFMPVLRDAGLLQP